MISISEVISTERILFLSNLNKTGALDYEERSIVERITRILDNPDQLYHACSINLRETDLENFVFGTFGIGLTDGEIIRASSNDMGYSKDIEDLILSTYPEINSVDQFMKTMDERESKYNDILIRRSRITYLFVVQKLYLVSLDEIENAARHFNLPIYFIDQSNKPSMHFPEKRQVDIELMNSYRL